MINGIQYNAERRAIHRVWTVETIQEEIRRLDAITGLNGVDVPCFMNKRLHCCYGQFVSSAFGMNTRENTMKFVFSEPLFSRLLETGTELTKLNTVRHEYAHYLAYKNGYDGIHGQPFLDACKVVDCYPKATTDSEIMQYLERVSGMNAGCISIHPENPREACRLCFEDALWTVKFHPMFGRDFLNHLHVVERGTAVASPANVLLKVERLKSWTKDPGKTDAWVYDSRLDTVGSTYEDAIINLANKVLHVLKW